MPAHPPLRRTLAAALVASTLLVVALAGSAAAAAATGVAPAAPLSVDPAKQVYAFDDPPILVRQIVFGLAHGVTLLARACLDADEDLRRPAQVAYEEWLMRYGERIIDSEQWLARHYFAARAGEAGEEDIARALKLPPKLDLPNTPGRLREACASFPEALARQRYNLDLVFATHRDEQRLGRAVELRTAVGQCRQIAAAANQPAIDAAFARWEAANREVEQVSRARWLKFRGDESELRRWQESIAAAVRHSLPSSPAESDLACQRLIADLSLPQNTLSKLMGDTAAVTPAPAPAIEPAVAPIEAAALVMAPAADAQPAPLPGPDSATPASTRYLILLGAWGVQSGAYMKSIQAQLTALGIPNFTEAFDSPRGARRRLRAGPFASPGAAQEALARIRALAVDGVIAPAP